MDAVLVMTPAEELYVGPVNITWPGSAKFAWFKMLNASARNCKFNCSVIRILLKNDVSIMVRGGPVKDPRDTFPKVPESGSEKAPGSK